MKAALHERLADLRVDMPTDVADRHSAAISAEVMHPGPIIPPRRLRRRWILPVVVAAGLLIPAAALAAETATPGDFLYPVKRTTEWMRSVVDSTVNAEHRVDELEIVIDRRSPIDEVVDRLADAEQSVEESDAPRRFTDRIDRARDHIEQHYGVLPRDSDSDDRERSRQDSRSEPPDSTVPPTSDTTTPSGDGPRDSSTTSTTETRRDHNGDSGDRND